MNETPAFALLLLGSNINPETNMAGALLRIGELTRLLSQSPVYLTPPHQAPGTPHYHNQAVLLEGPPPFSQLREILRKIEGELGRVRTTDVNAPRTIDIDILAASSSTGTIAISWPIDDALTSFHHAAIPAADIAGDWLFPASQQSIGSAASSLGSPPPGFQQLT